MAKKRQQDFSKVQLKPGCTISKRANITSTKYKSKKISMPKVKIMKPKLTITDYIEKIKNTGNVKDKSVFLNQLSTIIRRDADSLKTCLTPIFEDMFNYITDPCVDVRNGSLKVILTVFQLTEDVHLNRYSELICGYISAIMKNPNYKIAPISLILIDDMLKKHPKLICYNMSIIMDLLPIERKHYTRKMITSGKKTFFHYSENDEINALGHINNFLKNILLIENENVLAKNEDDDDKVLYMDDTKIYHVSLYMEKAIASQYRLYANYFETVKKLTECIDTLMKLLPSYYSEITGREIDRLDYHIFRCGPIKDLSILFQLLFNVTELAEKIQHFDAVEKIRAFLKDQVFGPHKTRFPFQLHIADFDLESQSSLALLNASLCYLHMKFLLSDEIYDSVIIDMFMKNLFTLDKRFSSNTKCLCIPYFIKMLELCKVEDGGIKSFKERDYLQSKRRKRNLTSALEPFRQAIVVQQLETIFPNGIKIIYELGKDSKDLVRVDKDVEEEDEVISNPELEVVEGIEFHNDGMPSEFKKAAKVIVTLLTDLINLLKLRINHPNKKILNKFLLDMNLLPAYQYINKIEPMVLWYEWLLGHLKDSTKLDKTIMKTIVKLAKLRNPLFMQLVDFSLLKPILTKRNDDFKESAIFVLHNMDIDKQLLKNVYGVVCLDSFSEKLAVTLIHMLNTRFIRYPKKERPYVDYLMFLLNIAVDVSRFRCERMIDVDANNVTKAIKVIQDGHPFCIIPSLQWAQHSKLFEVCSFYLGNLHDDFVEQIRLRNRHRDIRNLLDPVTRMFMRVVEELLHSSKVIPIHSALAMLKLDTIFFEDKNRCLFKSHWSLMRDLNFSCLMTTSILTQLQLSDEWFKCNVDELMKSMTMTTISAIEVLKLLDQGDFGTVKPNARVVYHILRVIKVFKKKKLLDCGCSATVSFLLHVISSLAEKQCTDKTVKHQPLYKEIYQSLLSCIGK